MFLIELRIGPDLTEGKGRDNLGWVPELVVSAGQVDRDLDDILELHTEDEERNEAICTKVKRVVFRCWVYVVGIVCRFLGLRL